MFAVVLGVSAFAPAMATPPNNDGHKVVICHYQEAKTFDRDGELLEIPIPEAYVVINIDKAGKMNGHFKGQAQIAHHFPEDGGQGDFVITVVEDEATEPFDNSASPLVRRSSRWEASVVLINRLVDAQ